MDFSQYKLVSASQVEDFRRPWWQQFRGGTDDNVRPDDVETLCSHSRRLYANLGPLRVAIQDKAMYCVGRAWLPVFKGVDPDFKTAAQSWLIDNWYPVSNVLGPEFDFQTLLYLCSVHLDVFSEVFVYLTETEDSAAGAGDGGYPQIQLVPRHRVNQPRLTGSLGNDGALLLGPYRGYRCTAGVIKNRTGRAIAFHVLGDDPAGSQDAYVSTDNLIRLREMEMGDETRAIPATSHGINQGRSILSLIQNEQQFLELASRIAIVENNELGGLDPNDPSNALGLRPAPPAFDAGVGAVNGSPKVAANEWQQDGGQTRYFESKSGGKITPFQFSRPGGEWLNFINFQTRGLVDALWPYHLVSDEGALGGANVRALTSRANRLVMDRQDLLRKLARRCVQYAVAKGSKIGRVPESDEWWMWDFTVPSRITVDYGRDAKAELLEIEGGILDPAEPIEARGHDYGDFLLQYYRNQALKKQVRAQVEQETGVTLEDLPEPVIAGAGDPAEVGP